MATTGAPSATQEIAEEAVREALSRPVYFLRLRLALERVVPCALEQAGLAC